MYSVQMIVDNQSLINDAFSGLDITNVMDRKRAYKKLPKSFQIEVDSATFASVVHIVMATLEATNYGRKDAPLSPAPVAIPTLPSQVVIPIDIEKINIDITKKDVDSLTDITYDVIPKQQQPELWGEPVMETTIEDRLSVIEKAIAELTSNRPQSTLNRVKIKPVRDASAPGNYKGYTVNYSAGKYRLVKRFGVRLQCIYVGVVWNAEKADAALLRWEAKKNNQPTMPEIQLSSSQ